MLLLFAPFSFSYGNTDNIKPKIELVSPAEATEIVRGEIIEVRAVLSDNIALEDYKVRITKGGTKSLRFVECFSCNDLTNSQFDDQDETIPVINGEKNRYLNFNIGVEKDAVPGDYTFSILVKDKMGNEYEQKIDFVIIRTKLEIK